VVTVQRQQQLQQQLQVSSPTHDDLQDPITQRMGPVDVSGHSWVAAYRRAGHNQMPRQLRVFGWKLLHAGVKVGARRMLSSRKREPVKFTCPAEQCQHQSQLETLSHLFVACPVAAAAWQCIFFLKYVSYNGLDHATTNVLHEKDPVRGWGNLF
jgi:hypothetical protein